ncbi:hypothetical protein HRR78_000212 [Exophiala dermatitidis]|nr:hypothetical protein HRR75_001119 [Exophiala dermatitidis]KAJ4559692.1 hypothetical protein HRR78_000212 [Exophiala dermatitidis]
MDIKSSKYSDRNDKGKGKEKAKKEYDSEDYDDDYDYDYDLPDKSHLYEKMHEGYTTKAMMSKHMGSDIYPARHASFNDHGNAQITRSNTRDDGDDKWHADLPRRNEVSRENYNNFNKELPKHKIQPRDFAYVESSSKHWKSPELGRDHSVTSSTLRRTIDKYPKEERRR